MVALYRRYDALRLGGAISLGRTKVEWENRAESESNDLSGFLFARMDNQNWFVSLETFFGRSQVESTRFPGQGLVAMADYKVTWVGASLMAGKLFDLNGLRLTPRLGASFSRMRFGGFTESGAGTLNLGVASAGVNSLELETGVLIAKELQIGEKLVTPYLNLGLGYETMDERLLLETRFANQPGIPTFLSESPDAGALRGIVEVGVMFDFSDFGNFTFNYKGSFRDRDRVHSASLGYNYSW
jgi:outer membrane autotransporter protein